VFDEMILDEEQISLLFTLIEHIAGVPREKRVKFVGTQTSDGTCVILHAALPGNNLTALPGDLEALAHAGLLSLTHLSTGSFKFDITPMGRKYYAIHQEEARAPVERVGKSVTNYIGSANFRTVYAAAFDKWWKADARLWSNESHSELSVIGHLCREAMQEFVTVLVDKYQPTNMDPNKSHDISRLRAVLRQREESTPKSLVPFCESLISYWGTLSDLVQRQEHAGQKEGAPVNWEDARRLVFHTAIVFLEIDTLFASTA
jgi:hypothetical protein